MGGATEDKTPSVTKPIVSDMFTRIWPAGGGWGLRDVKPRVCLALSLMVGSKVVGTSVPFLFRAIVDSLTEVQDVAAAATSAQELAQGLVALPAADLATPLAAMLVGYGVARSLSLGMQEARNVVFATVSQPAVRVIARGVFDHMHAVRQCFFACCFFACCFFGGQKTLFFLLTDHLFPPLPSPARSAFVTSAPPVPLAHTHTDAAVYKTTDSGGSSTSGSTCQDAQARSRVSWTAGPGPSNSSCRRSCSTWCPPCSSLAWCRSF
jgi:hypothetical protein